MSTGIEQVVQDGAGPPPSEAHEQQGLKRARGLRTRRRISQVALAVVLVGGVSAAIAEAVSRPTVEFGPAQEGGTPERSGWLEYVDADDMIAMHYPEEWNLAEATLSPEVVRPRELVTVTTGPLRVGAKDTCPVPYKAMRAIGDRGALVTVIGAGSGKGFSPRPEAFTFADGERRTTFAYCGAPGAKTVWFTFSDAGRDFHALVTVGRRAPGATRRAALGVLDSLEVVPPAQ